MSAQRLKVSQHVVHSFIGVLSELLAVRFEWIDHLDLHPALEPGTVPPGRICQSDHEFVLIRQFAGYGLPRSQGHSDRRRGIGRAAFAGLDRKSTRLNSSHGYISYAVFCLKKKTP